MCWNHVEQCTNGKKKKKRIFDSDYGASQQALGKWPKGIVHSRKYETVDVRRIYPVTTEIERQKQIHVQAQKILVCVEVNVCVFLVSHTTESPEYCDVRESAFNLKYKYN